MCFVFRARESLPRRRISVVRIYRKFARANALDTLPIHPICGNNSPTGTIYRSRIAHAGKGLSTSLSTKLTWINAQNPASRHTLHRISYTNNGDDAMTTYEQLYLAIVLLAFVTFGIVLATMSYQQREK